MKEQLIKLGFEKWLSNLDVAPYPVIFWDIPLFIQMSYIQKYLRDVYGIYVSSDHDLDPTGKFVIYYTNWGFINDPSSENYKYHPEGGYDEFNNWKTYEEALEFGLQEGLKLIKNK